MDGFVIDLKRIASLSLGRKIEEITTGIVLRNKSVHKLLTDGVKSINKLKANSIILLDDLEPQDKLIKLLIEIGLHVISSHNFNYSEIKKKLHSLESDRILSASTHKTKKRKKKISFK